MNAPARQVLFLLAVLIACVFAAACRRSPSVGRTTERPAALGPATPASAGSPPLSGSAQCVVLALPLQGPAKSVSEKVAQGANFAKREMERQGASIVVNLLDTDRPDWLNQLAALPSECALVGGPMHATAYSAAKNSSASKGRAFFTFLPQLEPGDEGVAAWRFFPSPQDQADALLGFLQSEMNFSSFGVFYPNDPYGARMAEIFRQQAALRGIIVQMAQYTPGASAEWPNAAAKLVGRREINKTPFPTNNLQALFLPNSWSSSDQLITSLHYNGEDRLVLLGDALWGAGIQTRPLAVPRNYRLAIFPAAWNPTLSSPGAQALRAAMQGATPDFWTGLGYDFLHFAANMKLPARWTPQLATQRAAEAQRGVAWSIAPIVWDAQGKARQALLVLSPVVETGGASPIVAPVQPEQLRASWLEAQARFAARARMARNEKPASASRAPLPSAAPPPWRDSGGQTTTP
jgi:ABC-type branched-subunit amino acid transport system substrate-binding protein